METFNDDVGCPLLHSDYHSVVDAFGGHGILLSGPTAPKMAHESLVTALGTATTKQQSVCVNAYIGRTDFRKGSISV